MLVDLKYVELLVDKPGTNAYLFWFDDGVEKWIPKSIAELDENSKEVTVPQWFVEKEGLEDYAKA